jgi:hypothetical protein
MRTISLLCLVVAAVWGQVPRYEVKRVAAAPVIDGKVDEAAWQKAGAIEFLFPWEFQTGAKQKTVARLGWDERYLYVSYVCEDRDITAQFEKRDDPTYRDDAVELFINPKPSQSNYFGLEMNARGVLYDYFYLFPEFLLKRMDFTDVRVKTARTGTGWSLELAISWADFEGLGNGKAPKVGDVWTANLNRWDGTEPARRLSQWSNSEMAKPNPHNPKRFGELVFAP